ncbi:hypothetical protein A2W24_05735 [Microgenomates group bacterium RBG_16_45_19]|nr:MAG: hypothetical protein A2W24_05735 [Microgenomates group bacterium RBG_16_45_19]
MPKPTPIAKLIAWYDRHFLALIAIVLIIFIPLFPKLPLFDLLPGYIVRVRTEDFLIALAILVWFIQFFRGQIKLHPLITRLIGLYLIIGFLSCLSAMFITKTVPLEWLHVGKLYLHYLRRLEYFSLFFIFYSGIKTALHAKLLIYCLVGVMLGVAVYGYGQKYFYWPVYSTMNREFSKGWRLYLTEHARVPSTFGGHYDAAAFTLIAITIILAVCLLTPKLWLRLVSGVAFLGGLWLLILTASRTSFLGYLASLTVLMLFLAWIKSWWWALGRWLLVLGLSLSLMLTFGDLSQRFSQLLGLNRLKEKYAQLALAPKVPSPAGDLDLSVASLSDRPPQPYPRGLPADVYEDIPDKQLLIDADGRAQLIDIPRTYSENAYKYGLSAAIRLDALWPRAVAGFLRNPLLGSGYSTLTKESVGQFTEAESTDNDYLRSLGETGLLGFISFFGVILTILFLLLKALKQLQEPIFLAFVLGFTAASLGLLLNAFYIDVFEASKVATIYWALAGLSLAILSLSLADQRQPRPKS